MKVFIAATSLRPAYGGPAVSVARLAGALAAAGVDVGLWAADRTPTEAVVLPRGTQAPAVRVRRLGGVPAMALARFGAPDVIHDNGIWLAHNHALAKLAGKRTIPRVVSTRGMLEPWAFAHKGWKKRVAFALYQRADLADAHMHHVTGPSEEASLAALHLGVPIALIPNGADLPCRRASSQPPDRGERAGSPRTALFLGRIYPVKGLPMLVEAWARVRPRGWRLVIAGPDEARHQEEIVRAVAAPDLRDVVSFAGALYGEVKQSALFAADLLVLPSHSESFGMVVAEALAHGVPVLTTTGTPWSGLRERGAGWWVEATVDGIAEGLRQAASKPPEALRAMGERGRAWMTADYSWEQVAKRFVRLYEGLLQAPAS